MKRFNTPNNDKYLRTPPPSPSKITRLQLFRLPFPTLALITVLLPLIAFVFCISWSFFFHFKLSTYTHCKVWNFAPSISSAIGVFKPQKYVWKICLGLHSAPRILMAYMYYNYYTIYNNGNWKRWGPKTALALNLLENLSLLGLSNVPSKEDFFIHKICFIIFLLTSSLYMLLSYHLVTFCMNKIRSQLERKALIYKYRIIVLNFTCIIIALYLYYRHNRYCEPIVYSLFSICEYLIVLSNMAYHVNAYYDFHDRQLLI